MSRRFLNDFEMEEALRFVVGVPDDGCSEDDLESDEGEEFDVETIQRILEE